MPPLMDVEQDPAHLQSIVPLIIFPIDKRIHHLGFHPAPIAYMASLSLWICEAIDYCPELLIRIVFGQHGMKCYASSRGCLVGASKAHAMSCSNP